MSIAINSRYDFTSFLLRYQLRMFAIRISDFSTLLQTISIATNFRSFSLVVPSLLLRIVHHSLLPLGPFLSIATLHRRFLSLFIIHNNAIDKLARANGDESSEKQRWIETKQRDDDEKRQNIN